MYLFIDASQDNGKITVAIFTAEKNKIKIIKKLSSRILAEDILVLLEKILRQTKREIKDFKEVVAVAGPGPYTALRVSLSITNALAYGLNIPIVGVARSQSLSEMIRQGAEKIKRAKVGKYVVKLKTLHS